MSSVHFSEEDKAKSFDIIAQNFYNRNFGRMSKADMELMMFNIYIRKLIDENKSSDGTIDYSKCSDYKIAKELGITPQRVKNLKIKNQLANPIEYDWEKAFATLTKYARYDQFTQKVVVNIPDPNLYLEIQNFLEDKGAYIEKQLNGSILQIRAEYYIELIVLLETKDNRQKIIKEIKKFFKENGKDEKYFSDKEIGKSLISVAADIATIISGIKGFISPSNLIGNSFILLLGNSF